MFSGPISAIMRWLAGAPKAKSRWHIYDDIIDAARRQYEANALKLVSGPNLQDYNRSERKDFWNDPERWDGIGDPWENKIWEVRRRDVIDVRPEIMEKYDPYLNAANQHPHAALMLLGQTTHFRNNGLRGRRERFVRLEDG